MKKQRPKLNELKLGYYRWIHCLMVREYSSSHNSSPENIKMLRDYAIPVKLGDVVRLQGRKHPFEVVYIYEPYLFEGRSIGPKRPKKEIFSYWSIVKREEFLTQVRRSREGPQ